MSLPEDYFNQLYAASDDPWQISTGWYEQRKRGLVLASLTRETFGTVFEPGCSNGELTVELARRCSRLIAWDVVDAAVQRTAARTTSLGNVEVRRGGLPSYWPDESAELVVLSEIGYYLGEADLNRTVAAAVAHLEPGGLLLGVHWRHHAPDYPLTGDRVHDVVNSFDGLNGLVAYRDDDFALDIWTTGPSASVARSTGVV